MMKKFVGLYKSETNIVNGQMYLKPRSKAKMEHKFSRKPHVITTAKVTYSSREWNVPIKQETSTCTMEIGGQISKTKIKNCENLINIINGILFIHSFGL